MIGDCIEIVTNSEDEVKTATVLAAEHHVGLIYVNPIDVRSACMARSVSGCRNKIYVTIDPKGTTYGVDKFKGVGTNFFAADGYDIVLTLDRSPEDIEKEIKSVYKFMKTMINKNACICFTISASNRNDDAIAACTKTFHDFPPNKIKTECLTVMQPTKANLEVHKNTIKKIRTLCMAPLTVCGNVTYNVYKELVPSYKIAVSIDQLKLVEKADK